MDHPLVSIGTMGIYGFTAFWLVLYLMAGGAAVWCLRTVGLFPYRRTITLTARGAALLWFLWPIAVAILAVQAVLWTGNKGFSMVVGPLARTK